VLNVNDTLRYLQQLEYVMKIADFVGDKDTDTANTVIHYYINNGRNC
jgi:hypothetical protein